MRPDSTPNPWLAARASPESFRRMRLKMGVGVACSKLAPFTNPGFKVSEFQSSASRVEDPGTLKTLKDKKKGAAAPLDYSAFSSGLLVATVSPASPTLKRAKRRTLIFSPSLPILVAIICEIETVWYLMKGCS